MTLGKGKNVLTSLTVVNICNIDIYQIITTCTLKLHSYMSVKFCRSVMSDFLWPRGLQHTRLPCPSSNPRAYSNSRPSSWWFHPTISPSVGPISSCLQSFPASGSFPKSWFFASCSQSIGASASSTVLPMNIQGWFPLKLTGLISLSVQGPLKSFLQHHSSKASICWHSS